MPKQQPQRTGIRVGEYAYFDRCRFCEKTGLKEVIDFGLVPLAGGFLPKGSTQKVFDAENRYPLTISFCPHCYLVQVNTIVPTAVLYKDYFYFSSAIGTLVNHFESYAGELAGLFDNPSLKTVVEIGCNDGVFLKPLTAQGFKTIGVDPATNVVAPLIKAGYTVINDGFHEKSAKKIVRTYGQADIILSSNSFAHIDEMRSVGQGVHDLLKPDGFFAFEVHYLGTLLAERQYDMMYHDHMSYYSLIALENFFKLYDMEIYDVTPIPIHAGSRRFFVQHRGAGRPVSERIKTMRQQELKQGLDKFAAYRSFYQAIDKTRRDLRLLLRQLKRQGKSVVGYGASGRATAIMSFCGITADDIEYVVDDAPAKLGAFTPGNHLEIKSSSILDGPERPDYALLFAWSFINEIKHKKTAYLKSGGKFIVPLPDVAVVGR